MVLMQGTKTTIFQWKGLPQILWFVAVNCVCEKIKSVVMEHSEICHGNRPILIVLLAIFSARKEKKPIFFDSSSKNKTKC